ncbi:hypothetical protein GQX74_010207 [Glossina fuscipes]|nr:hypothetical protein GQX74_010207 [Glossina fuscipes]
MFGSTNAFMGNRRLIFEFAERHDFFMDAFSMSDKSSTTNSLPNSPIHTNNNNNNTSLLNNNNTSSSNNNNNNNNNTCSANRNVLDEDSCFRMDADTPFGEKEPDPDNIKMFVGQVPKSMDEAQLREMFEENQMSLSCQMQYARVVVPCSILKSVILDS